MDAVQKLSYARRMPELEIVRHHGLLDYSDGLALQRDLHADVVAGRSPGVLVLCEHPSVYTAGRRTEPSDLPTNGARVVDTDRGGRITWHGPGQLVAYPIVRLAEPLDVVAWVPGTDGSPAAKVGAIGLHVAEGVTSHGIAINCDNALDAYAAIVPCGIADAGVTTLSAAAALAGRAHVTVDDLAPLVADCIRQAVDGMHSGRRISTTAPSASTSTSTAPARQETLV